MSNYLYADIELSESAIVSEKRLARRRGVVRVSFAFRPEIRAVFVFNQTIVYNA
jgi:hypothetical protein